MNQKEISNLNKKLSLYVEYEYWLKNKLEKAYQTPSKPSRK